MFLLALFTLIANASLTVNVQSVVGSTEQTLRVLYLSAEPLRLEVTQESKEQVFKLAASEQPTEVKFTLSLSKIDQIRAFQGKKLLAFPEFFIAAPQRLLSTRLRNTIGKPDGGSWVIKAGEYHIHQHLVIEAEKIIVSAGSSFIFSSGSSLSFKGETHLQGQASAPVVFKGTSGQSDFFVQLLQAPSGSSTLTHVILKDTKRDLMALPSGVLTLYGGRFDLEHLSLSQIHAEDALNGVKATINLQHLTITDVSSDGFDCDFCRLTLRDAVIEHCDGDGLDVSGSELAGDQIRIVATKDKALSIGEGSEAKLQNIKISQSDIGLAIKDASKAMVSQYEIQSTRLPFSLYTLKPWFPSPAELTISPAIADRRQIELKNGARLLESTP